MNEVKVKLDTAEGYRTVITAGKNSLVADEPVSVGGNDEGMSPYELLLASLGACTAITLKMYIDRKKMPVKNVEVHLSFDRIKPEDCEGCSPEELAGKTEIQHISRIIYLTGDVTEEQKDRLRQIANRCPVHITLHSNPHVEDAMIVRREASAGD